MKEILVKKILLLLSALLLWHNVSAFAAEEKPPGILVLGDSLSGAYGIDIDQGWVTLLQQQIIREGYDYRVINASVSGDTTRTGLQRLDSALQKHRPEIVIIALGGNDGLRGLSLDEIENSLTAIIERCRQDNIRLLLVGVRMPPNYGPVYNQKFSDLYQRLASRYHIVLVPKMLDQVADNPELMQPDGMHPAAEAQPQVMKNVWAGLKLVLQTASVAE